MSSVDSKPHIGPDDFAVVRKALAWDVRHDDRRIWDDAESALRSIQEQLEAANRTLRAISEVEPIHDLKSNMARNALNPASRPSERDPQLAHDYRMGMTPDE